MTLPNGPFEDNLVEKPERVQQRATLNAILREVYPHLSRLKRIVVLICAFFSLKRQESELR